MHMSFSDISVVGLVKELTREVKNLLKEEFNLFKKEMSEKASKLGRNSIFVAVGAVVGLIGLVLLFVALGELIAYAFENAGFARAMSDFMGFGIMAMIVLGIAAGLVLKGVKAFSKESMAPEKTMQTLKDVHPPAFGSGKEINFEKTGDDRSSREIQSEVFKKEAEVGETIQELGERLTPRYAVQQMEVKIRENPYQWSIIAMAAGLVSSLLVTRKLSHHSTP